MASDFKFFLSLSAHLLPFELIQSRGVSVHPGVGAGGGAGVRKDGGGAADIGVFVIVGTPSSEDG